MIDSVDKLNMLHWYCTHCSKGVKRVLTGMAVLKKRQDMMENEISNLKKDFIKVSDIDRRVEATAEKVVMIEKQVKEMDGSIDKVIETRLKEAAEEKEDKEKRCLNLVLFGIEESGKETPQERIQEDTMNVQDILNRLEISGCNFDNPVRLGARNVESGKIRPLRIKVKDKQAVDEILKKAKNLKGTEFSKCFISRDYTAKERMERKAIVEELKQRREDGDESLFIRNGRIVKKKDGISKKGVTGSHSPLRK